MKNYFYLTEYFHDSKKVMVQCNIDILPFAGTTRGSYAVLGARVMGLTYADYLRMCRDVFGATLIGKNGCYSGAVFEKNKASDALIKMLNARAKYIMHRRENPFEITETDTEIIKVFDIDGRVERVSKEKKKG